jgi:D-alanine-D-alanine ligase
MAPDPRRRIRVLLLFGGRSAEHDVSRTTAVSVAQALDPARYEVVPVGITTEGQWLLAAEAREMLEAGRASLPAAFEVKGEPVSAPSDPERPEIVPVTAGAEGSTSALAVDVVLPLLHGPYGEDGTVQGLLELAGLPYVGSGVLGSAVGMDKLAMKWMFAAAGLPTVRYLAHRDGHDARAFSDRVVADLGLPCFVKPANMGSSVGVTKAHDRAELDEAVRTAARYDEWVIAEEAVDGREIEVAVLGDDPPEASVPGEVIPGAEFYDYADKYEDGDAQLLVPAPLSDAETDEARSLAVQAFEACRIEAMARVDLFYEEGGRGFLLNELNTIPGFTPISMYPKLWEASGLPYSELVDRLIDLALARHERRARRAGVQRGLPRGD